MGGWRGVIVLVPVLIALMLLVPSALAVGIGVNKATISYENVLQNGYAEEKVLITTDSDEEIGGTYELEGELAPWIRIEPAGNFTFSRDKPQELTIIVEPPRDVRLQQYSGGVRILTGEIARSGGGKIGTSTRAAFLIRAAASVTGTELLRCTFGGVELRSTEIGQPVDFLASVHNTGNVRVRPDFTIEIFDQYQTRLVKNLTVAAEKDILPTQTAQVLRQLGQQLDEGQYWAAITSPLCEGSAFTTFDVLERGGISDKGEILRLEFDPWAETGEIVPIAAIFQNQGGRVVSAKFRGTIIMRGGDKIYKAIDTEPLQVAPGATARLETFFNPTEPGQYIVSGQVLYNSKLTYQKSAILNVQGAALAAAKSWGIPILLLMVIVVLLLLILIARKRRSVRAWPQRR